MTSVARACLLLRERSLGRPDLNETACTDEFVRLCSRLFQVGNGIAYQLPVFVRRPDRKQLLILHVGHLQALHRAQNI